MQNFTEWASEWIWQRSSPWEIIQIARQRFLETRRLGCVASAHTDLASAHYFLVENYERWWQWPLALWHLNLAAEHAMRAVMCAGKGARWFSGEEVEILTRILTKAPALLGGNRVIAWDLLYTALFRRRDVEMKSNTSELLVNTLRDLYPHEWRRRQEL